MGTGGAVTAMRGNPKETLEIVIRRAVMGDAVRVWEIRNHPEVRRFSGNTDFISRDEHLAWFQNTYNSGALHHCFLLEKHGFVIGYCRYDYDEEKDAFIVSIALDPSYHGRGFGTQLLIESLAHVGAGKNVLATVRKGNESSKRLFERAQFFLENEDESNYYYVKTYGIS